jgi:8-oxo-dGTP pyrophosphatase MutT (NUDIX family)
MSLADRLNRRPLSVLSEGRPSKKEQEKARKEHGITAKMLRGSKPAHLSWKAWLAAGGTMSGASQSKKPKGKPKKKKKGKSPLPYLNPKYRAKTPEKVQTGMDKVAELLAKLGPDLGPDLPDVKLGHQPQQMGMWGVGGHKKHKMPVKRRVSPEQEKLQKMARSLGTIQRQAAGGIVFKTFKGADIWDLPVLVSKVAPKWGNYFVFPKGGQDPGENLHQSAAREVREEAGVKAKVVSSRSWHRTSKFGDRGHYDLTLVMNLLKAKYPDEKAFLEKHRDEIEQMFFTYSNRSHYFVMAHTGGKPRRGAGHGHGADEMAYSEWAPLRQANKLGGKMAAAIKGLMPVIRRLWKPVPVAGYLPGKIGPKHPPKKAKKHWMPKPRRGSKPPRPPRGKQTSHVSFY